MDETLSKKIIITTSIICLLGIIMVFDASMGLIAQRYHYITFQAIWVLLGTLLAYITYRSNYKIFQRFAFLLWILCLIALIVVFVFSAKINGSQRWLNILGFTSFQPSEITKLVFIIYLSSLFTKLHTKYKGEIKSATDNFKKILLPYLIVTIITCLFIIAGKDMGTTIILATISIFIFIISDNFGYIWMNLSLTGILFGLSSIVLVIIAPYRLQRLLTYLKGSNQSQNYIQGAGYQVHQILIAIGSGGLLGVGFTQSIQKNQYLVGTTAITDSIFAVIAEEIGLIGALLVISLYIYLVYLIFKVAINSKDYFGKLLVSGIASWIGIQAFINIAANIGIIPLTGVPLPFISYGGSSIVVLLISIGLVLNIEKFNNEEN